MNKPFAHLIALAFLLSLLPNTPVPACTIAVISGSATSDGRPLLWKNRDVSLHDQEVRHFDDGSHGAYLALVTTGENETTTSYIGLNEAGLAIMNSVSPDLSSGYPSSHGILMKRALRDCGSVAEFEALLLATTGTRGHIWTNFGVIDALGEAAIFETTDTDFVRYDADDQGGCVVRANNSIRGGGDMGSRYFNAKQLLEDAILAGQMNHRFMIRTVARNLGDTPSMPCGEWPAVEPALNRHKTRSSGVVHGVLPGEDARLSTFWCTLGEPSCGVSVPLWACAGTPPVAISDPGNQAALCGAIREQELHCYSNLNNDITIDTRALVGIDGSGGIHRYSLPIENEVLDETAERMLDWRQAFPAVQEIAQYQLRETERSLFHLEREKAPGEIVPPPAADIVARPGNREITLTWIDPADDPIQIEVWRALMHDGAGNSVYPLYQQDPDAIIPARPTDRSAAMASGEWNLVDTLTPGSQQYIDPLPERGVYHYEIFARDGGYNYGPPAAFGDRATNYWLGDVSDGVYGQDDGYVDIADLTALGAGYGLTSADAGFLPACDTGPTEDFFRLGIPLPDDRINFEDLMIFSMNYSVVAPLPLFQEGAIAEARLSWAPIGNGTWALALEQPCVSLKGVNLRSDLPAGSVREIQPGALCDAQMGDVILHNIAANGLDVGLTLLGGDLVFVGAGELLRVSFADGFSPTGIHASSRDAENQPITTTMAPTGTPGRMPDLNHFAWNYPNPFNPRTILSYSLRIPGHVRLSIHDASGRLVRELVNGPGAAGESSVVWDGVDDDGRALPSGIYFSRLEAEGTVRRGKLTLSK